MTSLINSLRRVIKAAIIFCIALSFSNCNNSRHNGNQEIAVADQEYATSADSLITVNDDMLQLGDIKRDSANIRKFLFRITNSSKDQPIIITKIDVSCSCVVITDFPKSLEPGQSGNITGRIDLRKQSGHLRKSIFVNYNTNSIKMLKITANIDD